MTLEKHLRYMAVDTFVVELLDDVVTAEQDFVDAVMRWVPLFCWDVAALYTGNRLQHLVVDLKAFQQPMEINKLSTMITNPKGGHLGPMLLHMKVYSHSDMSLVASFVLKLMEVLKHLMEVQLHIDIQWDKIGDNERKLITDVSFPTIIPLMQPRSARPHSTHWYRHGTTPPPFVNWYVMQGHNTYIMCTSQEYVPLHVYTLGSTHSAIVPNIFADAMKQSGWEQAEPVLFREENKLLPFYLPQR